MLPKKTKRKSWRSRNITISPVFFPHAAVELFQRKVKFIHEESALFPSHFHHKVTTTVRKMTAYYSLYFDILLVSFLKTHNRDFILGVLFCFFQCGLVRKPASLLTDKKLKWDFGEGEGAPSQYFFTTWPGRARSLDLNTCKKNNVMCISPCRLFNINI